MKTIFRQLSAFTLGIAMLCMGADAIAQDCSIVQSASGGKYISTSVQTASGQSFQACQTGKLESITIDVAYRQNSSATLQLFTGVFAGSIINVPLTLTTGSNVIDLSSYNIQVTGGSTYSFQVNGGSRRIDLHASTNNAYGGGSGYVGNTQLGTDLKFEAEVSSPPTPAGADCTIAQDQGGAVLTYVGSSSYAIGQTFVACQSATLKELKFYIPAGSLPSINIEIRDGSFTGTVLGSKIVSSNYNENVVDFSDLGIEMIAGQTYAFRMTAANNLLRITKTNTDAYSLGTAWLNSPSGANPAGGDVKFEVTIGCGNMGDEDFESYTIGSQSLPNCWISTDSGIRMAAGVGSGGSNALVYGSTTTNEAELTWPATPDLATKVLQFVLGSSNGSGAGPSTGTVNVYQSDGATDVLVATLPVVSNQALTTQSINFAQLSNASSQGDRVKLGFTTTHGQSTSMIIMDDITLSENTAPTSLSLSATSVDEELPAGTLVGTLSATDPTAGDSFTYSLSGMDAASFAITSDQLITADMLDFETKASYDITLTVTDQTGGTLSKDFTIAINDVVELGPNGLQARYLFTNGSLNDEQGGTAATTVGAPTRTQDRFNQNNAYQFSIANNSVGGNHLRIPAPVIDVTQDFAINFWFKKDANNSKTMNLIDSRHNASGGEAGGLWVIIRNDNKLSVATFKTSGNPLHTGIGVSAASIDLQEWYMMTIVRENGTIKTYLDGVEIISFSPSSTINGSIWSLGAIEQAYSNRSLKNILQGSVDDVSFYANAINQTVIDGLYSEGGYFKNTAPTALTLSSTTVDENKAAGTQVGQISVVDDNPGDTHTYTLSGTDASKFSISGNLLLTDEAFDFETKSSYALTITATDAGGLTYSENVTISIEDINEAPTDIALSANAIEENQAVGTVIGTLSSTDQDSGDSFTYTINHADFTIDGAQLKSNKVFDYEANTAFTIQVTSTDAGGESFAKNFTISVTDVYELVALGTIADQTIDEDATSAQLVADITAYFNEPTSGNISYAASHDLGSEVTIAISGGAVLATAANDYNGSGTVTITATSGNQTATQSFDLTVSPVNDAPRFTYATSALMLTEDDFTSETISLSTSNPSDEASQTVVYSLSPATVDFAMVAINASTGVMTVQHIADAFGSQMFTITANDGQSENNTATQQVEVVVSPVDDTPVVSVNGATTFDEDFTGTQQIALTATQPANESQNVSWTLTPDVTDIGFADVSFNASTGIISVSGIANANGSTSITASANDGTSVGQAVINLVVNPVNDAPTFTLDRQSVTIPANQTAAEIVPFTLTIPKDEDNNQPLSMSIAPNSFNFITATVDIPTREVTITPVPGQSGSGTITVIADDSQPTNNTYSQDIFVEVLANQAPRVVNPIANVRRQEDAGSYVVSADVSSHFTDDEGDALTYTVVSDNSDIIATLNGNQLTLASTPDYFGSGMIQLTASDQAGSATDTFEVNITPVNDEPVFTLSPSSVTFPAGSTASKTADLTFMQPQNENNQTISVRIQSHTLDFISASINRTNNQLTLTPVSGYSGSGTLTLIADDGEAVNNTYTQDILVEVQGLNPPRVTQPIADIVKQEDDEAFTAVSDLANHFTADGGGTISYEVVSDNSEVPAKRSGSAVIVGMADDYFGSATITVTATNADGSTSDSFVVTAEPVNDAPVMQLSRTSVTFSATQSTPETIDVSITQPANESNQNVSLSIEEHSLAFVTATIDSNTNQVILTAVQGESGNGTLTVLANDGQEENSTYATSISVEVLANQPPRLVQEIPDAQINEDDDTTVILSDLNAYFADDEGEAITYAISSDDANVTASVVDQRIEVTPATDFNGVVNLTVTAADGNGSTSDVFILQVTPVNDAPTGMALSNTSIDEEVVVGSLVGALSTTDVDGADVHVYTVSGSELFAIAGTDLVTARELDFETLDANPVTLTITTDDGNGGTYSQEFTIMVNDVDEAVLSVGDIKELTVEIYPNPATDYLKIGGGSEGFDQYQLSSVKGVSVKSGKPEPNQTIDLSDVPAGIYLLRLWNDQGDEFIQRIIKQ